MSVQELRELDLQFDPYRPSLKDIAGAGHSFSVPWSKQKKMITTGLDASHLKHSAGPWVLTSPFDLRDVKLRVIVPDSASGRGSYRDGFSTTSRSTNEHISASLAVTVGYPFLNASVSGKYDKTIIENDSGVKMSRNFSCRVGRVILDEAPQLSESARKVLQIEGPAKFRQAFGDYYVCGYELGADAGACLSGSTFSKDENERLQIEVKVKVLFFSASISHTEESSSSSEGASFAFAGYNTLEQASQNLSVTGASIHRYNELATAAFAFSTKVQRLYSDVRILMDELGLKDGVSFSVGEGERICESGLVVALLLAPFARLNQFVSLVGRPYLEVPDLVDEAPPRPQQTWLRRKQA